MLSISAKIPRKLKRSGAITPVIPLIPEKKLTMEQDKGNYLTFELKKRVGQPESSTKYKKHVRRFEEGTPQQWLDLLKDLEEVWTQNSMTGGTDRASTVRALVKGESLVTFEAAIQDDRTTEDGVELPLTLEHVNNGLKAVTVSVFPHRALEIQKLWMKRKMFKPVELSTRQTSAAISRLNNYLPLFPSGTVDSKFSEVELIELLEWSLPQFWRQKFDLDNYIPTEHPRAKLVEACEAIERNEEEQPTKAPKEQKKKFVEKKKEKPPQAKKFMCSIHGPNFTHESADCWTLKNKEKLKSTSDKSKTFSNKQYKKELNLLSKKSPRKEVLEMYALAIQKEQAKLAKQSNKRKAAQETADDSDSDMSIHAITESTPMQSLKKRLKKTILKNKQSPELSQEEEDYQKKVSWLQDHGEGKEVVNLSDNSTSDSE